MNRFGEEVKARSKSLFEGQRRAAAEEIGSMVNALHRTVQELNQQDQSATAHYIERAASSLERVAGSIRDQDLRTLVRQMEGAARRNPGMFFGGSLVAGFIVARFLKSSAEGGEIGTGPAERRRTESRYV
jgi:hypothetical protein